MASSLNLLVLRLAQFHSENGIGGISALLGRNEEELIAAAIAEHRASIHVNQHQRIYPNNYNLIEQRRVLAKLKNYSPWSSPLSSTSSLSYESKFYLGKPTQERTCSMMMMMMTTTCRKRSRRRQWHIRRSPQNIKHLLDFQHFFDNHKYRFERKSFAVQHHAIDPTQFQQQQQHTQRVSI
jgi:hypothetical protein